MMSDLTLSDRFNNMLNCCDTLGEALEPFNRLFKVTEGENILLLVFKDASYTFVFQDLKEKEPNTLSYFSGENMFDREDFLGHVLPFLRDFPIFIKDVSNILKQFATELEK